MWPWRARRESLGREHAQTRKTSPDLVSLAIGTVHPVATWCLQEKSDAHVRFPEDAFAGPKLEAKDFTRQWLEHGTM